MQSALPNPAKASVLENELRKQLDHEIRMEVEFCLTEGLKDFNDLGKTMKNSPTVSLLLYLLTNDSSRALFLLRLC